MAPAGVLEEERSPLRLGEGVSGDLALRCHRLQGVALPTSLCISSSRCLGPGENPHEVPPGSEGLGLPEPASRQQPSGDVALERPRRALVGS